MSKKPDLYDRIAMPLWNLFFGWTRRFRKVEPTHVMCCGRRTSEWFIDKDAKGDWGMKCWHCGRVQPWISHADYREYVGGAVNGETQPEPQEKV